MYETFTDEARRAMQYADESARKWNHDSLSKAHIILGLFKEDTDAVKIIRLLGCDPSELKRSVENTLEAGKERVRLGPLNDAEGEGRRVIQLSRDAAVDVGANYIGTEHILLGSIKGADKSSLLAEIFDRRRITYDRAKEETARFYSRGMLSKAL